MHEFGAVRKYDIHTGVDIHMEEYTPVYAFRSGVVVHTEWFTGELSTPPTPWWLPTRAVWVQHEDKTVAVYGEIAEAVIPGETVSRGDLIGYVLRVLRHDKGLPTAMLHFELYCDIPSETVTWKLGEPKPPLLLDPTDFLKEYR